MAKPQDMIFISYAHENAKFANGLVKRLNKAGYQNIWIDKKILGGKNFRTEIQRAISECRIMIVILSPAAVSSSEVESEYSFAQAHKKIIIPILHQICPIPMLLTSIQQIDFSSFDQGFTELQKALPSYFQPAQAQNVPKYGSSPGKQGAAKKTWLIGIGVDLSKSMKRSMDNNTSKEMSRLEGFQHALNNFLSRAKEKFATREAENAKVFIYGFGLRVKDMEVFDILTLLKCAKENSPVSDELKRQLREDLGEGLFDLITDIVTPYIVSDVIVKAQEEVVLTGGTTLSIPELSKLIPEGENYWDTIEDYIYGETPMQKALEVIYERFDRELAEKENKSMTPILCVVSDGLSTDGTPKSIEDYVHNQNRKITIVSCFITSEDIGDPLRLYREPQSSWKEGSTLLFDISSQIPSDYMRLLSNAGWKGPNGERLDGTERLFIQANHSSTLEKFLGDSIIPTLDVSDLAVPGLEDS